MSAPLARLALRHYLAHPWQAGLALIGVALGVAVLVSIEAANGSALMAFELSTEAVAGRASHRIVGGSTGVPEEIFTRLRVEGAVRPSTPVVEGRVTLLDEAGSGRAAEDIGDSAPVTLRLIGIDPLTDRPFRSSLGEATSASLDLTGFLTVPGAVILEEGLAESLGWETGRRFGVRAAGREVALEVMGVFRIEDEVTRSATSDLLIADISTAQEALGQTGVLSRIDLIAPESESQEAAVVWAESVRSLLPPGVRLEVAGERVEQAVDLTRSFRLNLRALSLLALFCGAFLIYNTMTFAVVQRRHELGTLRALGVTRRELLTAIQLEALLIGAVGTAIGVPAGLALARRLLSQVTQTINDHYFVLSVNEVALATPVLVAACLLGVGVSLLGALAPALEAVNAPPRASLQRAELEETARRLAPRTALAGICLTTLGGLLLWIPARLDTGFTGFFLLLLGVSCFLPLVTRGLVRLLTPLAGLAAGNLGRIAARGVGASLSRTAVAVAALTIAVSVSVGVDLMIRSFRSTVDNWLEASLPADLYVSPAEASGDPFSVRPPGLAPGLIERLRGLPGAARVNTVRQIEATIRLKEKDLSTRLLAYDLDERGRQAIVIKEGGTFRGGSAWEAVDGETGVFVSEPLAFRHGIEVGDALEIETPAGPRRFAVAAIHYDYASERGAVLIGRALYERLWDDRLTSAASIYAAPGVEPEALIGTVRSAVGTEAQVRSNRAIRRRSLEVFDRTFVVTRVLRLLALLVAAVGVLSALTALQMERTREIGVLRAAGLTPMQILGLVTSETGLMGLIAGLMALPVGGLIAVLMIRVINRRSFGWSMALEVEPWVLAGSVGLAVAAALVAGLYPAWRISRLSPAVALRGR